MSISESHANYILEKIFRDNLLDGVILTADELEEEFEAYKVIHPDLTQPTSLDIDFDVDHGGYSSASLIGTIATALSDDASIITREFKDLAGKSKSHYERWTLSLARLINKAKKLEHDIDSLLLLQGDTAGFFAYVADVFSDLNKVDMSQTTARVDVRETTVTLNPDSDLSEDASLGTRINLNHMNEYDITFSVLTDTPANHSQHAKAKPLNAFKSQTTSGDNWISSVSKSYKGSVVCELKARISRDRDIDVSKIVYSSGTQNAGGNTSVLCQWSVDGYQWYAVDAIEPLQALENDSVVWMFPLTSMRWIKFLFTKNNYDNEDNGTYFYDFGARSIRLYGHNYVTGSGGTLITKALQPLDAEGEAVTFSLVSLDSCEEVEDTVTDIRYYVSASANETTGWTSWAEIQPVSREIAGAPPVLNIGGSARSDSIINLVDISKFDATKEVGELTTTFDSGYDGYTFKKPDHAVVNAEIPYYTDTNDILNPNHVANSIQFWRNIFNPDNPANLVRDTSAGWGFENSQYYCSFYVVSSDGLFLDFGDTDCIIDGVKITGKTKVFRGVHTFRTEAKNWLAIDASDYDLPPSPYVPFTTEEILKEYDKLYPYNHKHIMEGFRYIQGFEGEKVYQGVDIIAQFFGRRTSTFNLENNLADDDYLRWFGVLKGVGDSTSSPVTPACAVLLRRDLSFDDYPNELCRVSWRSSKGLFKYIKLKTELSSTVSTKTPVLTSYRLKVGA